MKYPSPTKAGHYWAKWKVCDDGTDDEEDFTAHKHWEVVDVFENHINDDEDDRLRVHVSGVRRSQHLDNFVWGTQVFLPKELEDVDNPNVTIFKPPLPAGVPDTPEIRSALQEYVEHGNNKTSRQNIIAKILVLINNALTQEQLERETK